VPDSKAPTPKPRPPWAKVHTDAELEAARAKARESDASLNAQDYTVQIDQVRENRRLNRRAETLRDAEEIQDLIREFRYYFARGSVERSSEYIRLIDPRIRRHLRAHISQTLPDDGLEVLKIAYDMMIDRILVPGTGPGDLLETRFLLVARHVIVDAIRSFLTRNRFGGDMSDNLSLPAGDLSSDPEASTILNELLAEAARYPDGRAYLMRMEGRTTKQIAEILQINERTVDNYVSRYGTMIRARLRR
jgi:hypothetical protein